MMQTSHTIATSVFSFSAISANVNLISESGLVIPKGTLGRILSWTSTGQIVIDFGLMTVFTIPADSPLILIGGQR